MAAALLFGPLTGNGGLAGAQTVLPAIIVPDTVDPGARVTVSVTRNEGGTIILEGPLGQTTPEAERTRIAVSGGQVLLTAPSLPGSYRIRHLSPSGRVLATAIMDVSALPVTLGSENPMGFGVEIPVRWRGPAAPGDRLVIVDPASGEELSQVPALGVPGDLTATRLPGVQRAGEVELRYVTQDGVVLQRLRLTINPPIR